MHIPPIRLASIFSAAVVAATFARIITVEKLINYLFPGFLPSSILTAALTT